MDKKTQQAIEDHDYTQGTMSWEKIAAELETSVYEVKKLYESAMKKLGVDLEAD